MGSFCVGAVYVYRAQKATWAVTPPCSSEAGLSQACNSGIPTVWLATEAQGSTSLYLGPHAGTWLFHMVLWVKLWASCYHSKHLPTES